MADYDNNVILIVFFESTYMDYLYQKSMCEQKRYAFYIENAHAFTNDLLSTFSK